MSFRAQARNLCSNISQRFFVTSFLRMTYFLILITLHIKRGDFVCYLLSSAFATLIRCCVIGSFCGQLFSHLRQVIQSDALPYFVRMLSYTGVIFQSSAGLRIYSLYSLKYSGMAIFFGQCFRQ